MRCHSEAKILLHYHYAPICSLTERLCTVIGLQWERTGCHGQTTATISPPLSLVAICNAMNAMISISIIIRLWYRYRWQLAASSLGSCVRRSILARSSNLARPLIFVRCTSSGRNFFRTNSYARKMCERRQIFAFLNFSHGFTHIHSMQHAAVAGNGNGAVTPKATMKSAAKIHRRQHNIIFACHASCINSLLVDLLAFASRDIKHQ